MSDTNSNSSGNGKNNDVSTNKILNIVDFKNGLYSALTKSLPFSDVAVIQLETQNMICNMQAFAPLNGGSERLKQAFNACNDDGSFGFYLNTQTNERYISGSNILRMSQILISNSDTANENAAKFMCAVNETYEQAQDYRDEFGGSILAVEIK